MSQHIGSIALLVRDYDEGVQGYLRESLGPVATQAAVTASID
jgi:hypothetical protein